MVIIISLGFSLVVLLALLPMLLETPLLVEDRDDVAVVADLLVVIALQFLASDCATSHEDDDDEDVNEERFESANEESSFCLSQHSDDLGDD